MKPYEKFNTLGPQTLTDAELLAIMIRTGTPEMDAISLAEKLLDTLPNHNLTGLCRCRWQDLTKTPGIGEVKAIRLKCIAELARRISETMAYEHLNFTMPDTIYAYYKERLRHESKEKVILIFLDQKCHFLSDMVLSVGTVNYSVLSVREVFKEALRRDAVHLILIHNHPSGDPNPSEDDIRITKRLAEISKWMEIPLLDHLIIGDNSYISLRTKGIF